MKGESFKVVSKFAPAGDQPQAIDKLHEGIQSGLATQMLLGVTGSGKTFHHSEFSRATAAADAGHGAQ